ncbi:hypothetical protein DFO67_110174 [Modicisalibacter xianhensis]|uniref:Uncharacterized protein n=1 Tax=Modicisalibacter xianhensis TaxID=442341 RepID=A0A4R8FY21_9GAMM|nr:hypothetical protein [Halomonas xianhensis]TDX28473.1 hypothetical protein DFO67_110174 [Halomonas xianhensis]
MIKNITKKALRRVGYEVRRKYSYHELVSTPSRASSGIILEFVGPSGIGKTTFFGKVKEDYRSDWLFRDDLKCTYEIDSAFALLTVNEGNAISRIMHATYLSLSGDDFPMPLQDRIYSYLVLEMKADILFRKTHSGRGLLSEDGLIHNFCSAILEASKDASPETTSEISKLFKNRHFINFKACDNYIIENLKKRKEESPGAGNDWIGNLGVHKALEITKAYQEDNERMMQIALSLGSKVQEIDIEDDFENNRIIFREFINSITNDAHRQPESALRSKHAKTTRQSRSPFVSLSEH